MSLNDKSNQQMILSDKSVKIQNMFDKISTHYDFLNRLLSFRQDVRWRKKMISSFPKIENKEGIIYDIACGTGDVLFQAKSIRDDYSVYKGFDISNGMLEQARIRAQENYKDIKFVQASAESIPVPDESSDCITIAFGLRNVDNREVALLEFYRILKKGGTLLILEFFQAENSIYSKLFNFYFKNILPKIGGMLSDRAAYEYLPQSVSSMPTGSQFEKILSDIGFIKIEQTLWLGGATRLFKMVKKS